MVLTSGYSPSPIYLLSHDKGIVASMLSLGRMIKDYGYTNIQPLHQTAPDIILQLRPGLIYFSSECDLNSPLILFHLILNTLSLILIVYHFIQSSRSITVDGK